MNLLTLSFLRAVWSSLKNKVSDKIDWEKPIWFLWGTSGGGRAEADERLKMREKIPRRSKKVPRRVENFKYYYHNVQNKIKYLTAIL